MGRSSSSDKKGVSLEVSGSYVGRIRVSSESLGIVSYAVHRRRKQLVILMHLQISVQN